MEKEIITQNIRIDQRAQKLSDDYVETFKHTVDLDFLYAIALKAACRDIVKLQDQVKSIQSERIWHKQ